MAIGKRKMWLLICVLVLIVILGGLAVVYLSYNRPADKALFIILILRRR